MEQLQRLEAELLRVSSDREALERKEKRLTNIIRALSHSGLLLDGEVIGAGNLRKFEILAIVWNVLVLLGSSGHENRGLSTKELFEKVSEFVSEPLNYGTFRSYLSRFRDEGRIEFERKRRVWRLVKESEGGVQ